MEDGKGGRMDEKFRTNTELEGKKQVFLDIWPWGSKGHSDQVCAEKILEAEASFL